MKIQKNKSCLREEPVYIDTMHSRVQNYKNITAWVKNPITRAVMRIATMEAMNEGHTNHDSVLYPPE